MPLETLKNLTDRDREHIWHPLTQHKTHPDALGIVRAKGALLYDETGKSYIDGIASWYTCMYGHCNDYIISQLQQQMATLDQIVFSGFTHEPAVELAEALIPLLPSNQKKIFFSDNGSTAVEVAIKMAYQYHHNKGGKKPVLLAFENGFHGDTFGAMSASGLSVYNGPFEEYFLTVERIPLPDKGNIETLLKDLGERLEKDDVAAFIYEPLVQGAAGMKMYEAEHLEPVLKLLKSNGVLCIADEVMTGFGKTGSDFASSSCGENPDIICLSKALTAGMLPMAITSCTQEIYDAFYSDELAKGLFHGHTYTANPLACRVALAGIELLKSESIQARIREIEQNHSRFDLQIREHPKVVETRQCGVIYALDLRISPDRYGKVRDKLFKYFMDKGVFLRPLGNTVYVLPPYCISDSQLAQVYDSIKGALDKNWDL